jgi:predicted nucleic acid-binding protein
VSAERAVYLDSSALVKLAIAEPESAALRRTLRRQPLRVCSALARTEVARALLPFGDDALARGEAVLRRIEVVRINDRVLRLAGRLQPPALRSLDAIHLATAQLLDDDLKWVVTYDERMTESARLLGMTVRTPH